MMGDSVCARDEADTDLGRVLSGDKVSAPGLAVTNVAHRSELLTADMGPVLAGPLS
jgi:hypothetical protein